MENKSFYLTGIMILLVMISGCTLPPNGGNNTTSNQTANPLETACLQSGGSVINQPCCNSATDFPNTCLIGACGCSPNNSHNIKACDCGDGKCFNGSSCVDNSGPGTEVFSFDECAAAGYPVTESYPSQCRTPGGQVFTQETTDPMEKLCNDSGGNWNICSSRCALDNQGKENAICTMQCEALCECGGLAGFKCPVGYTCKTPSGVKDALGYCTAEVIGGMRDEYGCLGPAGYSWDENVSACTRAWELNETQKKAAGIAIGPLSYRVTVISVTAGKCDGCFNVSLQRNDNQNRFEVELENWTFKQLPSTAPAVNGTVTENPVCVSESSGTAMELKEALSIASSSECTQNRTLTDRHSCNAGTGTWWIDININKTGCNPACVVNIDNKTAEINWRCTGLLAE